LETFLSAEASEAGDVGHAIGVLELVEVLSEGGHKLVGQGHQPVDQEQEFPDLVFRIPGVEQAHRPFQAQDVGALGLPSVAFGGLVAEERTPDARWSFDAAAALVHKTGP